MFFSMNKYPFVFSGLLLAYCKKLGSTMLLHTNTTVQHLREDGISSILNETDNKYPESAREADAILAYPAQSNTSGRNRLTSPTDFISMMSHDLRAYVNGFVGLTSLLFNTNIRKVWVGLSLANRSGTWINMRISRC